MTDICAIPKCFYCGEDKNEILLATRFINGNPYPDMSKAHGKVIDMEPCDKCQALMGQGVILLTIDADKSPQGWNVPQYYNKRRSSDPDVLIPPNPYRTGGFFVLRDEAIARMFDDSMAQQVLRCRWSFIEHEAAERIGLFASIEQKGESDEA